MSIRALATSDIHIGRCSTRTDDPGRPGCWPCSQAWDDLVRLAIDERVDLVALSGDVVDRENRYYEAIGPLVRGLRNLTARRISVYAVAGNHDHDVLPRAAEALGGPDSGFHLLGRGGRWEEAEFVHDGAVRLRIQGWSFPGRHAREDPLAGHDLPRRGDGVSTLGLLHADLDAAESPYAPVSSAGLRARPVDFWLLGHVHHPRHEPACGGGGAILYPGSPQAIHPGEPGPHGPWLLTFPDAGPPRAVPRPISRVRYESVEVDLTGSESLEAADARLRAAIDASLGTAEAHSEGAVEWLGVRIRLIGRTALRGRLDAWSEELVQQYRPGRGGLAGRIESVVDATTPAIDLEQLARMRNPAGRLAEMLLRLERDRLDVGLERLLRDAQAKQEEVDRAAAYQAIREDARPDREAIRRRLIGQGMCLLDALLAQEQEVRDEWGRISFPVGRGASDAGVRASGLRGRRIVT